MASIFVFGIGLFLFAWTTWFWLSWILLFIVGFGSMIPMGTAVLQLTVPRELQGRVLSLWYLSAGLMFVGALPIGFVADTLSWPVAISGGAAIYLVISVWLGLWRPVLRQLRV